MAQLKNLGHQVAFESKKVKIFDDGGKLVGIGAQSKGNLFYLDNVESSYLMMKNEDAWLWNKRLCHVNFDNMIKIIRKKNIRGFPSLSKLDHVMCHQCQKRKMTKSSFKSKDYSKKRILELVHTNLCGPMRTQSYYGDRYFIMFVDDYTRLMTIMFLKEKSKLFKMFKWYTEKVEKETGKELKFLRSDRGGEFIYDEFTNYLMSMA